MFEVLPPNVAVIVVVPTATARKLPLLSTVATLLLVLAKVGVPLVWLGGVNVTVILAVSPTSNDVLLIASVIDCTGICAVVTVIMLDLALSRKPLYADTAKRYFVLVSSPVAVYVFTSVTSAILV